MKKWLKRIGIALAIILIGIQLIPVNRTNPPITREVKWNAPETRALAQRACCAAFMRAIVSGDLLKVLPLTAADFAIGADGFTKSAASSVSSAAIC